MKIKLFLLIGIGYAVLALYLAWHNTAPFRQPASPDLSRKDSSHDIRGDGPTGHKKSPDPIKEDSSTSSSTLGATPQLQTLSTEAEFLNYYPGSWQFTRTEHGRLSYISGGTIPNIGQDILSIKQFIVQIAPLLEVPSEQISDPTEMAKTDLTRAYHSKQIVDGYPVYQASLSVHVRESDKSIFMVNNQLKDVSNYQNEIRYSRQQAEAYIQSKYANELERLVFREGPIIFKSPTQPAELAWVFTMTYKQPKLHQVEIVIGAFSGQELHRQNVNIQ